MSKQVDLEKPISDEDREYLKQRSRYDDIEENDRQFKKGKFEEPDEDHVEPVFAPTPTVAAPPIEPGSDADHPPRYVGQRPYGVDRGVWGGSTGVDEQEALAGESAEPHSTQEESDSVPAEEVAVEDLNVEELRAELSARDLSTSGNKHELQTRLSKALDKE